MMFRRLRGVAAGEAAAREPQAGWSFKQYSASLAMLDKAQDDVRRRDFEQAEAHLATARCGLGEDKKVLTVSAEIPQAQGLWPEAQRRWQIVIDRFPEFPLGYAQRALAVRQQGEISRAASLYHDLIRRFAEDVGAPIALVQLIEQLEEGERAKYIRIAEQGILNLIRLHPDYAILFVTYARLARMQGDPHTFFVRLFHAQDFNRNDSNIWKEIKEIVQILEDRRRAGVESLFR